jgi:hypothetical protein
LYVNGTKVAGDRNSLFRSLALLQEGDESQDTALKNRAEGYVYDNWDQLCKFVKRKNRLHSPRFIDETSAGITLISISIEIKELLILKRFLNLVKNLWYSSLLSKNI